MSVDIDVIVATCLQLPEPDPDEQLLAEALAAAGLRAEWRAWDDPAARFDDARLVVIRSTWNYHHRRDRFVTWAQSIGARLLNPPSVVRWNSHKGYLRDLEARGVAIVPTALLTRGEPADLAAILDERDWHDVVIKPAVSAGSFATTRVARADLGDAQAALSRLLDERDVLVQPYVASVNGYGERSLVWIDGAFTHAIRKAPRFAGGHEAVTPAVIADDERALAGRILDGILDSGHPALLYGRVDLCRDADGQPRVMEIELIEPSLFLLQNPAAAARLAAGIAWRVA